jgi:hypothetical protein
MAYRVAHDSGVVKQRSGAWLRAGFKHSHTVKLSVKLLIFRFISNFHETRLKLGPCYMSFFSISLFAELNL